MKAQQETIPVFFTVDEGYAPFLSVAIQSLIEHASPSRSYAIYVIYENLSEQSAKWLMAQATDHVSISLVEMESCLDCITDRMSNRLRADYFTLTIYFRLFLARMFPQYDKGIYLDSDIVVLGDVGELYDTELDDNLIGACVDLSIQDVPELVHYIRNGVGVPAERYINSGVLLLNLQQMRKMRFDEVFLNLLNTYHFDCIAPDQDYINVICHGRIRYLDAQWDVMPQENTPDYPDSKLIHYNLFAKPWCYDGIQYAEYFWKYARQSRFYDAIQQYKDSYSAAQKESDSQHMALMIQRAVMIGNAENNFRTTLTKLSKRGQTLCTQEQLAIQ